MFFDEVSFPLRAGYGSAGGPAFQTEIVTLAGGFERRNQLWSEARRRYDARTGVKSLSDAAVLLAFFEARAGRARGFRLKDWRDFTSAADGTSPPAFDDQIIGTGDGLNSFFSLMKTTGETRRRIAKPVAESVRLGVDGTEKTEGFSVDITTGLVSFAEPPAAGQIVTAGFAFDVPVRFDTDRLTLAAEDDNLFRAEIPIVEIRV